MKKTLFFALLAAVALTGCSKGGEKEEETNPVISIQTQPQNVNAKEGAITQSLTVSATVTMDKTLNYQWYSNTTHGNTGGTAIDGATAQSYKLPTTLVVGTYYYYCVLSADGAASVTTNAVIVEVTAGGGTEGDLTIDDLVGDWNVTSSFIYDGDLYPGDYTVTFTKKDDTTLEIPNFLNMAGLFETSAGEDLITITYDAATQSVSLPVQLLGSTFDQDGWPAYLYPFRHEATTSWADNYNDKTGFVNIPVSDGFVIDFSTDLVVGTIDEVPAYASFIPLTQDPAGTDVYSYGWYYVNSVFTKASAGTAAVQAAPRTIRSFDLKPLGGNRRTMR